MGRSRSRSPRRGESRRNLAGLALGQRRGPPSLFSPQVRAQRRKGPYSPEEEKGGGTKT